MKKLLTLILAFTFTTCYAGDLNDKVIVEQKQVEYGAGFFSKNNGWYAATEPLHKAEMQATVAELQNNYNKVEDEVKQIRKLLEKLLDNVEGGKKFPADPEDPEPTDPTPTDPAPAPGDGVSELDVKTFDIFIASCAQCHDEDTQLGGLQLVDTTDPDNPVILKQTLAMRAEIHDRTYGVGLQERGKQRMPKGDKALEQDEVEILRLWMMELSDKELEN